MWLQFANLSGSHAAPSMHMCIHHQYNGNCALLGGSKPQEAAQDAASAVKSAVPAEPKEAAKDAASAAKDSLPEPPKDIPNPFQSIFGEAAGMRSPASDFCVRHSCLTHLTHTLHS